MSVPFEVEFYKDAITLWPPKGRHILASFTNESVIVFQAYKPSIADWVFEHQTFIGCPGFSLSRMTWIKPNFLWMMYRSRWASNTDQEKILAISVKRESFENMLSMCETKGEGDVRLQWDPDHDPVGEKVERRAIQLGIRGTTLQKYLTEWILSINDITDFVQEQRAFVNSISFDSLKVPVQRVYNTCNDSTREHLNLDNIHE